MQPKFYEENSFFHSPTFKNPKIFNFQNIFFSEILPKIILLRWNLSKMESNSAKLDNIEEQKDFDLKMRNPLKGGKWEGDDWYEFSSIIYSKTLSYFSNTEDGVYLQQNYMRIIKTKILCYPAQASLEWAKISFWMSQESFIYQILRRRQKQISFTRFSNFMKRCNEI